MGSLRYTVQPAPEVDAKVQGDLDLIVGRTLDLLGRGNVHSILLAGGFGRGEGSVWTGGGRVRVVNDYDLIVVPPVAGRTAFVRYYRGWYAPLEALAAELAATLGMKQIDLALKSLDYFRQPRELRIENYEVKHGHRVLWGGQDPCDLMPAWRAEDLPLFDGTWLFRNRGFGLLMARLYLWAQPEPADADRENFFIECNKAWLAMGDALLLERGFYHPLHAQRLARARGLDVLRAGEKPVVDGYIRALEWKLRPAEGPVTEPGATERWMHLAGLFASFFLAYEGRRLSRTFADWREYTGAPRPEDRWVVRTLIGELIRSRGKWRQAALKANRGHNIALIGLLLAAAARSSSSPDNLAAASRILGYTAEGEMPDAWLEATLRTFRIIHPGGEVANLLARFAPAA